VIFVNIACYRDPECGPTVRDLFHKARYPERINVGVILQALPEDRIGFSHPRVRFGEVNAALSQGACWARALGYLLWQGEEHVLQIDSHMRFAPDWDVKLLAQLEACPSPKPLLTAYPPGYEPPDVLMTLSPAFLAAKEFNHHGILLQQGLVEPPPAAPKPTAFLAAGFLFGPSAWVREVPYDPKLYFHGEEITLAARLWTHGWDLFGPTDPIIWHQYGKTVRPLHWSDNRRWGDMDALSLARVRRLLRMTPQPGDEAVDLTGYDLGTVRTLAQYQAMAGVDFNAKTIAPHALAGQFALAA
jgi:glycosyltransferase involved in cell wall biosynthesis